MELQTSIFKEIFNTIFNILYSEWHYGALDCNTPPDL